MAPRNFQLKPLCTQEFPSKCHLAYMFLPPEPPYCTSKCTSCFVLSPGTFDRRVKRSVDQIIWDIQNLRSQGFSVFPATTELLMFDRFPEILETVNSTSLSTNGRILIAQPELLRKLEGTGIKRVRITANFDNSGLVLTDRDIFERAISIIIAAGLEPSATITVTPNNLGEICSMAAACHALGVRSIKLQRYLRLEKRGPRMLTDGETLLFFRHLAEARARFPDVGFALERNFGTVPCKLGFEHLVIGLDNYLYPCLFLTQVENRIGKYEGGQVLIDKEFRVEGGLDCPAYHYLSSSASTTQMLRGDSCGC